MKEHLFPVGIQADLEIFDDNNTKKQSQSIKSDIFVSFFTIEKTINSGLIINIGLLIIIVLIWIEGTKTNKTSTPIFLSKKISQRSLQEFERL